MNDRRIFHTPSLCAVPALAWLMALLPATAHAQPSASEPGAAASAAAPGSGPAGEIPSFETVVAPSPAPAAAPRGRGSPPSAVNDAAPQILPIRQEGCPAPEPMRAGFYLRVLGGAGYARFHGTGPHGSVSASGLASHSTIAIGGGLARGLAVAGTVQSAAVESTFDGGPFSNATLSSGDGTATASSKAKVSEGQLGALVDWYPNPSKGLHLGLSVGLGALSLENDADASKLVGTAVSGSVLVGYDVAIARAWALGLTLIASGVTTATMKNTSGDESGYKLDAFSVGLAASILYF